MKVKTLLANLGYLGNVGEGLQKFWGAVVSALQRKFIFSGEKQQGKEKGLAEKSANPLIFWWS